MRCTGFKDFKCLRVLKIPYQGLFGSRPLPWPNVSPSPSELLPNSLQTLGIGFPRLAILDWLARIIYCHDDLPDLLGIYLGCSSNFGDSFELLIFINHDHPAIETLRNLGIDLEGVCAQGGGR